MTDRSQAVPEFGGRTVPPATPPLVNANASAEDAATRPDESGDSDFPGSNPDEIEQPGRSEPYEPSRSPDEIDPGGGDIDEPGSAPVETPPPAEPTVPPPPD
jgi:hypothetical protein